MQSNPGIEDDQIEHERLPANTLVGTVLDGKYRIERLIGAGAMGSVFAGTHAGLDKPVAVKILHPRLAGDPRACQRFLQEAHAIGSLNHKNVVSVDGCGRTGDYIYIAMDYLEGESLAHKLKTEGRLPVESAVSIVAEAARGLAHAHTAGILHRDTKPSNIMLCRDTVGGITVKVVDFGIAKVMQSADLRDGAQNLTSTNAALGTPYYMSPEQCAHQELDARSDIYSLGCVLFECVSGRVAFDGDSAFAIMLAHLHDEPNELPPDVPDWLRSVIYKAMAPNRDDRYRTMDEFIAGLESQTLALPAVPHKRTRRRNNRVKIALACATLTGAMMAVGFVLSHSPERPAVPARVVTLDDDEAEKEIVVLQNQAVAKYENGDYQTARNILLKAIDIGKATERKVRYVYWPCYYYVVNCCIHLGNLELAEHYAQEALDAAKDEGLSSPYFAQALVSSADVLYARGQKKQALVTYEQAISIARRTHLGRDLNAFHAVEHTYYFSSFNYVKLNPDGAIDAIKQVPAILEACYPKEVAAIALAYWHVCNVQLDAGRFADARQTFQQCLNAARFSVDLEVNYRIAYAAKLLQIGKVQDSADQYLECEKFILWKMPPSKPRDNLVSSCKAGYAACLQRLNAKRTAPMPN